MRKNWWRRAMKPSDIPRAIANTALMGIVLGPFIAMLINWVGDNAPLPQSGDIVEWWIFASIVGAVYAVSFYITTGMPWIWLRSVIQRLPHWAAWPFAVTVCAVGGSAGAILAMYTLETSGLQGPVPEHWYARVLLIDALIAVAIGLFMGIYHHTVQQAEIRERRLAEAAAKAQAFALQAQIAPHFFFNTLNTISALVPNNPAGAQAMIGRLASMFRHTLASGKEDAVPLATEVEFVSEYLALEQVRYRERLRYSVPQTIPEGLKVPPLTLQPLVENAIRYGVARRLDGGEVQIRVEANGSAWCVRVENDFDPAEPPDLAHPIFREGHSLANVRDRLRLTLGPQAGIEFARCGPERFCAVITVPMEPHAHAHRG